MLDSTPVELTIESDPVEERVYDFVDQEKFEVRRQYTDPADGGHRSILRIDHAEDILPKVRPNMDRHLCSLQEIDTLETGVETMFTINITVTGPRTASALRIKQLLKSQVSLLTTEEVWRRFMTKTAV